jgi:hypothetical protein
MKAPSSTTVRYFPLPSKLTVTTAQPTFDERAKIAVADVGQMGDRRLFAKSRVLKLDEVADLDPSATAQSGRSCAKRPDAHVVSDAAFFEPRAVDGAADADLAVDDAGIGPMTQSLPTEVFPARMQPGRIVVPQPIFTSGEMTTPSATGMSTPVS